MRAAVAVGIAVAVAVALAGCVSQDPQASPPPAVATPTASSETTAPTPLVTETIPPTQDGSIEDEVPDGEVAPTQEAELTDPVEVNGGVVVEVAGVERVTVEATTPGEIAGPARVVTLSITNNTDAPIALDAVLVSVTADSGDYGEPTSSEPSSPFATTLGVGQTASGIYVFRLAETASDALTVTVQYATGAPVVLFTGG